jgi:hypothetical protein
MNLLSYAGQDIVRLLTYGTIGNVDLLRMLTCRTLTYF